MKNTSVFTIASLALFAVIGLFNNSDASLVLPDDEFEFAAPVTDSAEAVALVATPLVAVGFNASGRMRVRDDGFFRTGFTRGKNTDVYLRGRVNCVYVGIYTSHMSKSPEQARSEASELKLALIQYLQSSVTNLLLFKASGCEEAPE